MIILYTGKQGSGKSFRMTSECLSKDIQKKFVIFHNIDGLKKEAFQNPDQIIDFNEYIKENDLTHDLFFTEEVQTDISHKMMEQFKKPVLLVVDEAYDYFGDHSKPKERFLSYHRHIGMRVMFICIQANQIHYKYRAMIAYEIRAKLSLPFFFVYQKYEGGVGTGNSLKFKNQKVFNAYKSYTIEEHKKMSPTFIIIIVVILVAGGFYFWKSSNMLGSNKPDSEKTPQQMAGSSMAPSGTPAGSGAASLTSSNNQSAIVETYTYLGFFKYRDENGRTRYHYLIADIDSGIQYHLSDLFPGCLPLYKSRKALLCLNNNQLFRFINQRKLYFESGDKHGEARK